MAYMWGYIGGMITVLYMVIALVRKVIFRDKYLILKDGVLGWILSIFWLYIYLIACLIIFIITKVQGKPFTIKKSKIIVSAVLTIFFLFLSML
ncbi:hypothetical protein [Anaerosacchariphilus polymeriproducens]|uniref:Uncharacterized protein n=1 Tax=Anaerosacchariphilus polymeriproducens TaxID=1812858 RepID=A0A371AUY9_9FIRM|nr:hypothetical protein [Anaerosacchariphilus polymeriproducens]RDU23393.1 hypothetical protein DWV06_10080 [Anaerosacchariphilus polymeriproducens]